MSLEDPDLETDFAMVYTAKKGYGSDGYAAHRLLEYFFIKKEDIQEALVWLESKVHETMKPWTTPFGKNMGPGITTEVRNDFLTFPKQIKLEEVEVEGYGHYPNWAAGSSDLFYIKGGELHFFSA